MSKDENYDYTASERKKREREEMKKKGFRRMESWVHDDDWDEVKNILEEKKKWRLNNLHA